MNVQKMFTLHLTVIIGGMVLLELNAEIVSGIKDTTWFEIMYMHAYNCKN